MAPRLFELLSVAWVSCMVIASAQQDNSYFTRWRPISRFIAPAGWMNDPCGAMYDPVRDEYHLFYQWNPNHIEWGNISWGHATSKDLITWADVPHQGTPAWRDANAQALAPTGENGTYNRLGIFSGTAQPVNLQGRNDGTLLIFYTSVSQLPISWNARYIPGSESQSLAVSTDGGRTWQDFEDNPVISSPPADWNITGWRDPFFQSWPEIDDLLQQSEPHYYAVLGSGIRGVGPRMPLYSAPAADLTNWTFLGALWEPQMNTSFGPVFETGSWAFNFEVSNFFSLSDEFGDLHYFVSMGTEGGNISSHPSNHWSIYNEGTVARRPNGSVAFTPVSGGATDWGLLYAQSSFVDTKRKNRRVQWGWAPEDILDSTLARKQGFQGAFGLPRELFAHVTKGLSEPGKELISSSARIIRTDDGTYTASTLGMKPLEDVVLGLRQGATHYTVQPGPGCWTKGSLHMEFTVNMSALAGCRAGVYVAASAPPGSYNDGNDQREHEHEWTTIYYDPSNHTIAVDRRRSTTLANGLVATDTVQGYFAPYILADGGGRVEDIRMQVFLDGSLLEIYVNGRFALTTRIYPSREDSVGYGTWDACGGATFSSAEAWVGTMNIWPERPLNSSSVLR